MMRRHSILREGFTLFSGNVVAQAITLAAYFIVTRLFTPEDIGIYNMFFSYIEVIIIFSTGKYEMATVLADDDREAMAVSSYALRLNMMVSLVLILSVVAIVCLGNSVGTLVLGSSSGMSLTNVAWLMLLIPPMVFFCGTSRVYTFLFNRRRRFESIAGSDVVGSTVGVVLKVVFGFLSRIASVWSTLGLPVATVVGKAASNLNYAVRLRSLGYPMDITRDERRAAARKYRNFPLFTMPKDFINSLSANLPLIWLALYFDKGEVGLFALALTFVFRPVNILNNIFEKLLNVRVAEKVRQREHVARDIGRFFLVVNLVALPVVVVAFLYGGDIFAFLFGDRWEGCIYYIRCLLPWTFVALTTTSLMFIFGVFGKQRVEFAFFVVLLFLRVVSMLVGIQSHNFQIGILLFSVSGAVLYLAVLAYIVVMLRRYEAGVATAAV